MIIIIIIIIINKDINIIITRSKCINDDHCLTMITKKTDGQINVEYNVREVLTLQELPLGAEKQLWRRHQMHELSPSG